MSSLNRLFLLRLQRLDDALIQSDWSLDHKHVLGLGVPWSTFCKNHNISCAALLALMKKLKKYIKKISNTMPYL